MEQLTSLRQSSDIWKDLVLMINGSDAIDNVKDKLYSQQILGQSNLPCPKTMLVKIRLMLSWLRKILSIQ